MKNKFLLPLIALFLCALIVGTTYSAWSFNNVISLSNPTIGVEVLPWGFDGVDFARLENVGTCNFLNSSRETTIVSPDNNSVEAVRFTNTAGTQTKDHTFIINLDRDYTIGEIKTYKVEFDYYHAQKRAQTGKGFPKCQLQYNGSNKGNNYGGGDTIDNKAPFIATSLDNNWWHLEYFITSLCPTFADHGDSGISENTKINGVKITDSAIYDYSGNTAFIVVDNFRLDNTLSSRLGLFNKGTSFKSNGYYWMKVCWSGSLVSANITFDDDTIAEYAPSNKSPFYIYGKQAGTVVATCTLVIGNGQTLSISNTLTVT